MCPLIANGAPTILMADWTIPDLPPWATEALKQFPLAAVLILVGRMVLPVHYQ